MPINSRTKGAAYERELAADLRAAGFGDARRGQQFSGGADSPDVVGLPGWHIEAKRIDRDVDIYGWMAQALRDAGFDFTPVVVHRKSKQRSVAILDWKDFLALVKKAENTPCRPPGAG